MFTKIFIAVAQDVPRNPCQPSPCGPNSQCKEVNGQAVCSCNPGYLGTPPGCRPECTLNSECPHDKACINMKCKNPCEGTCGRNAECRVVNHSPICSCRHGFTGDAFSHCSPIPRELPIYSNNNKYIIHLRIIKLSNHILAPQPVVLQEYINPCQPSPCGPFSECRDIGGTPSCSCQHNYVGTPPNCRPECIINQECPSNQACIREKCTDPCPGSCGANAQCNVINHIPICTCPQGYTGNAFENCFLQPQRKLLYILHTKEISLV